MIIYLRKAIVLLIIKRKHAPCLKPIFQIMNYQIVFLALLQTFCYFDFLSHKTTFWLLFLFSSELNNETNLA